MPDDGSGDNRTDDSDSFESTDFDATDSEIAGSDSTGSDSTYSDSTGFGPPDLVDFNHESSTEEKAWDALLRHAMRGASHLAKEDKANPTIDGRRRLVLCQWPRKEDRKAMPRGVAPGKVAGNGLPLWGATLLDFYMVNPSPNIPGYMAIATGSQLAAFCRQVGELEAAEDELRRADREPKPMVLEPHDVGRLVEVVESEVHIGMWTREAKSKVSDLSQQEAKKAKMFDHESYPSPWPLAPFACESTPLLQKRLPFHLLPKKLVVHDPDDTLSVDIQKGDSTDDHGFEFRDKHKNKRRKRTECPDRNRPGPDKTRIYTLKLSLQGLATARADRATAEKEADDPDTAQKTIMIWRDGKPGGDAAGKHGASSDVRAPIVVKIPPPPRVESVPEAHLYLSREKGLGVGNHSHVHIAEWELPRALLVAPRICEDCVAEDGEEQVKQEEAKIAAAARGPQSQSRSEGMSTVIEKMGHIKVTELHYPGVEVEEEEEQTGKGKGKGRAKAPTSERDAGSGTEPALNPKIVEYDREVHEITTRVKWYYEDTDPGCKHRELSQRSVPPTATVRVAAKLSFYGDPQLRLEAINYQRFPKHLFEYWSGYNILPPERDPVPVRPVVPQFYGYYCPDLDHSNNARTEYLSPIMLVEDVGKPIDPTTLNRDDRQECASLLFRLHKAGFLHNSVFERNICMQLGDIQDFPLAKRASDRRFRLIDFGRASWTDSDDREYWDDWLRLEAVEVNRLFKTGMESLPLIHGQQ
ncbi:hypothetical protein FA95DRAFT_1559755 [Auriscalpium vulgare]|uniref:Uncharacterized protein n=1 Tax=Auriscalpium vulgare TaxID=40419 RepID=A0ACB8RT54_9AGAM|nr:hypothetical protein FA95DRAFT_1559755 [Auriscalpium vulgare]